jgi:branched-chain amino acid transport system substrate-binding protein
MKTSKGKLCHLALCLVFGGGIAWHAAAWADSAPPPLKIGVLDDMTGPNSENSGVGTLEAIKMAVEDYGGKVLGRPIQLLVATDQNKPDIAVSIAREWYTRDGVSLITGLPNSASSLAVNQIARELGKVNIVTSAASADITGKGCSPNSVHWFHDTYADAKSLVDAMTTQGANSWFFITVDYNFGLTLEADATRFIEQHGKKVLGSARHPLGELDFSNVVLRAQASGANVIGLANASADLGNTIKVVHEFHVTEKGQRVVAFFLNTPQVEGVGQEVTQGMITVTPIFPALNAETVAWSERFAKRLGKPRSPSAQMLGAYGATLHYLKAVAAAGTDEGAAVMAKMRELPVNDLTIKNGHIRADGRLIRDLYVVQVKPPSESTSRFDYFKVLATIPGDQAFRPLSDGVCPYAK